HDGSPTVGASDWEGRVGVFSLVEETCTDEMTPSQIGRVVKLVMHQIMHMFGILHCCYYRCLMNGAEGTEGEDSRPPYLCAMCLKKLHLVTGLDPLERYSQLAHFWAGLGCKDTALWYQTRVRVVQSTFS
ncbi:unnamed protein product, partial [Polarella glacialis]